ncbi:exodeoxyribonuclease VII small subunit [bacterium]|nr:exodeoxyribonuclease VII small subunit [Candidatus Elulimicrobium humile]
MKKTDKSFKQVFSELEQLTKELENNDALELEKGVKLFEHGMELAQICKSKLSIMENKIINIKNQYDNNNEKN